MDLLDQVIDTCRRFQLLAPGDRVVIGLSGGPDSVALLDILCRLRDNWRLSLFAVHLNHMLRGEQAEEDLRFCQDLADRRRINFYAFRYDVAEYAHQRGLNVEDAGRKLRYRLFDRVASETGANRIAVAHHRNDVVETFFMRLLRGAGMQGLASIPPKRGKIVRPFYEVTRADVEAYCKKRDLSFRIDPSNESTAYMRNKLRLEVLPYLSKLSPNLLEVIARTIEIVRAENEWVRELARQEYERLVEENASGTGYGDESWIRLPLAALEKMPLALKRRVFQLAYQDISHSPYQLSFDHIQELIKVVGTPEGAVVNLPEEIVAQVIDRDIFMWRKQTEAEERLDCRVLAFGENRLSDWGIVITVSQEESLPKPEELAARLAHQHEWLASEFTQWEIWLDRDSIKFPLVCSARRPGDRFRPLGMQGTKRLKDYLIDRKVPAFVRDRIPLLRDKAGIVAVVGYQQDERTRIHSGSKRGIRVIVRRL